MPVDVTVTNPDSTSATLVGGFTYEALWTPAQITTELWLDADDSGTITLVSGMASEYQDKSGNARDVSQSNSARRPALIAAALNGRDVLRFDGSNDALARTSGLSGLLQNVTGAAIFTVRRFAAAVSVPSSVCRVARGTSTAVRFNLEAGRTSGRNAVGGRRLDADGFITVAEGSAMSTEWQIHCGIVDYQNADLFLFMDGSLSASNTSFQTSGASSDTAPQLLSVGAGDPDGAQSDTMNGDIAEIIILNSAPAKSVRQLIEGYLGHKWGLAGNLPADHPYKSAAPVITP